MRSRLLYIVPLLLTAGPAWSQYYENPMYITNGPGPIQVYNRRPPPNLVEADGPNALYPVKSYVIERQPIVLPAPQVTVQNTIINQERIVYRTIPRKKHVVKPPCRCAY